MKRAEISKAYDIARDNRENITSSLLEAGYPEQFAKDMESTFRNELGLFVWNKWADVDANVLRYIEERGNNYV
jgi:hypothetical protein